MLWYQWASATTVMEKIPVRGINQRLTKFKHFVGAATSLLHVNWCNPVNMYLTDVDIILEAVCVSMCTCLSHFCSACSKKLNAEKVPEVLSIGKSTQTYTAVKIGMAVCWAPSLNDEKNSLTITLLLTFFFTFLFALQLFSLSSTASFSQPLFHTHTARSGLKAH